MAMMQVEYTSPQTNTVMIAATPGKIILVLRLMVSSDANFQLKLKSDPGGASEADLTPQLYLFGDRVLDVKLGRAFGLAVERGKALGITSAFVFSPHVHSLIVWYEIVD